MKKTLLVASMLVALTLTVSVRGGTNEPSKPDPLPRQFDDMITNNVFPPLTPVAIYRVRSNGMAFICTGGIFRDDTNSHSVILPEHAFSTNLPQDCIYAIRIIRPDSHRVDGFVGKIQMTSTDIFGCDIVVATVSTNGLPIKRFSAMSSSGLDIISAYTNCIMSKGKEVRTLQAVITGKSVPVIGRATPRTKEMIDKMREKPSGYQFVWHVYEDYPLVMIEEKTMDGQSGSPYIDEHGRMFFLKGRLAEDSPRMREERAFFEKTYGRPLQGLSIITGPLSFER